MALDYDKLYERAAALKNEDRVLGPETLEKLLWAQVPDEMIAAYFGLALPDMLARIKADPALEKAYHTGRLAGKAELMKAQMKAAVEDGDRPMLQYLGAQHLGQRKEPVVVEMTVERRMTDEELAKALVFKLASGGKSIKDVIDVEAVEVKDA